MKLAVIIFCLNAFTIGICAQDAPKATLVDKFGRISNDDLMWRVISLYKELSKDHDSAAIVIVSGNSWQRHTNLRRIEGCHEWLKIPTDRLKFLFGENTNVDVEIWVVPKGMSISNSGARPIDYALQDLTKPVEFSASLSTEEYCPRIFDLSLFARFLDANPAFTGKVVIDSNNKSDFLRRVVSYREKLGKLRIESLRVRYFRHHFHGERDEQFWLIPPKRK